MRRGFRRALTSVAALLLLAIGLGPRSSPVEGQTTVPRPAHVVIVIEENHSYAQIIGNPTAPYINCTG